MNLYCKKCNTLLVENLKEAKKGEVQYVDEYDLIPKGKNQQTHKTLVIRMLIKNNKNR